MASLFQRVEPLTKDAVFFPRAAAASDSRAELLCAGCRGRLFRGALSGLLGTLLSPYPCVLQNF